MVTAERDVSIPFAHGPVVRAVATVGPVRMLIALVSALLVVTARRARRSRSDRLLLWVLVLVVVLAARWHILTLLPVPDRDATYNLHEATVLTATGRYPPVEERLRDGYMFGFHYLLAALMHLTGTPWGTFLIPALLVPVLVVLVRRTCLPPRVAPLTAFLLGTQTYHIVMTSTTIPTTMTLPMVGSAVVVALAGGTARARAAVLLLVALAIGLSHSGGFVYLTLALSCTAAWQFLGERQRLAPAGIALAAAALICLAVATADHPLYRPGLLAGLLILLASRIGSRSADGLLRLSLVVGAVLLLLSLNVGVGEYWRSRNIGGAALGLLALVAFLRFRTVGGGLELPFLLALPHALWSFAAIPGLGYAMGIVFRMRIFISSALGIAFLAASGLDTLLARITEEPSVRRAVLWLIVVGLVASQLDRVTVLGADELRLGMPAYWAVPRHPPGDLRDIVRFIEDRPETGLVVYHSSEHFHEAVDKRILRRGFMIPPLSPEELSRFCASDAPPLVVVDRYMALYTDDDHRALLMALDGSCYRQVYANPTFRAFAAAP